MQNRFELARKVADAASHLDFAKSISFMAPEDRAEAEHHINNLHTVAQLLAGPKNAELYLPEVKNFEADKPYTRGIIVGTKKHDIQVSHWWRSIIGDVYACIAMQGTPCSIHLPITPTEARQLAVALMDTADDMEASTAQYQREQAEIKEAA